MKPDAAAARAALAHLAPEEEKRERSTKKRSSTSTKTRSSTKKRPRLPKPLPDMSPADVASLLEVVASESPGLLPSVVHTLASSSARPSVLTVCRYFRVSDPADLPDLARDLARDLTRLERRWRPETLEAPNFEGLTAFADRRAIRWAEVVQKKRPPGAVRTERLLRAAAESARARRELEEFLSEKSTSAGTAGALAMIRWRRRR